MPLVTAILPDLSYTRGRRCSLDYGLFLLIGQIRQTPSPLIVEKGDGYAKSPMSSTIEHNVH